MPSGKLLIPGIAGPADAVSSFIALKGAETHANSTVFSSTPVAPTTTPCPTASAVKNALAKKVASGLLKKLAIEPAVKELGKEALKPNTVKGVADLVKAAGKSLKPLAKLISPELAKGLGKTTNKGTVESIGKSLRGLAKKPVGIGKVTTGDLAVGGVAGGIAGAGIELGTRYLEGKPLLTKATAFKVGAAGAKGVISGVISAAIAGAVVGSVVPGPGTAIGFVTGLVIGVAVGFAVDAAAKPVEDWAADQLGIQDD